ncbi:MAG: cell envelope biogenesis protein OmpA [Methylophaga sp.]|nr:MAG: cell envelope biogenesis protein OmpA [Methylophaga sp.]
MLIKYLFSCCFILLSFAAPAEQFQASFTDTQWQVIESPLECTLSQDIIGFGNAKFTQQPGKEFSLIFTTPSHPSEQTDLYFEIAQAPWQNIEERLRLTTIPLANNQKEFRLSGKLAKQAFTHIEEGKFPTIRYRSHKSTEDISALLSTVHFRDSQLAFTQCLDNLFPHTFAQMRKLTVHFHLEKSNLNTEAKVALSRIAEYVKIDDSIKRVAIAGHTDNHGRKRINIPLSKARAITIKNYLVQQGNVPENLITTSSHREFIAAATNKSLSGRAINRRAEIELFR